MACSGSCAERNGVCAVMPTRLEPTLGEQIGESAMKDSDFKKDAPEIQKERIKRLVSELNPIYRIEFYRNRVDPKTRDIRFKIYDSSTNRIVCSIKQDKEWASSDVADKGDSELRRMIVELISTSSSERASS